MTQKTAWFMLHRIRHAMQTGSFEKASARVEIDETFVGGKAGNMHKHVRAPKITGTGGKDKTALFGVLERGGKLQAKIVADRKRKLLQEMVKQHVEPGAEVFADALKSYAGLGVEYIHEVVDRAVEYVRNHVHTNGMENFWSLLKRSPNGTYISVAPFHLFRYADEQALRFNQRKDSAGDLGRFRHVLRSTRGRRLTYAEVTGKLTDQEAMRP